LREPFGPPEPGAPPCKEFRKNAEDCLKPARETKQIYAKLALIEVGTEFRGMADHLGRDATPRTAERVRQRVHSFPRSRRQLLCVLRRRQKRLL
jgi:hypothetical protein